MHRILVIGVLAFACLVLSAPAAAWSWPADGAVLRPFGLGPDPYAAGQHRGIDVGGPDGSTVRAPAAGIVTFDGSLPTHGRGVTIQTEDGYAVTLVHLGAVVVTKGVAVAEGAPVGTMGSSGTPEHAVPSVHLGIRRAGEAEGYVDPLGLLPPRAAPPAPAEPPPAAAPAPVPTPVPAPSPPAAASPPPPAPPPPAPAAAPPGVATAAQQPAQPPTPALASAAAPSATHVSPVAASPPAGTPSVRASGTADPSAPTGMWIDSPRRAPTAGHAAGVPERPAFRVLRSAPTVAAGPGSPPAAAGRRTAARPEARAVSVASTGTGAPIGVAPAVGRERVDRIDGPADSRRARRGIALDSVRLLQPGPASGTATPAGAPAAMDRADPERGARSGRAAASPTGAVTTPALPTVDRAVPLGPVLAAFALGCVLAIAGAREGARRIAGNGAVLRHDAHLLRELDPAHRARVHDSGRGHLRAPPATARP